MEDIYRAWDAQTESPGTADVPFAPFAASYLERASKETPLPLNGEQARFLADLVDSFVDEAHERHLRGLGAVEPERAVVRELAEEFRTPAFTREEIDAAVASGGEDFAGLSPDEIRDGLKAQNRFLGLFKRNFLKRCGDDYAAVLKPYLDEGERSRAEALFSASIGDDEYRAQRELADDPAEMDAHVSLTGVQAALARGRRAKEILDADESAEGTEPLPKCLNEGFSGKLLSRAEKILRKLTAVAFLLARMAQGEDDMSVLPFAAVGAARYAYDWVTERKATLQLVELGSALKELMPSEFEDEDGKEASV